MVGGTMGYGTCCTPRRFRHFLLSSLLFRTSSPGWGWGPFQGKFLFLCVRLSEEPDQPLKCKIKAPMRTTLHFRPPHFCSFPPSPKTRRLESFLQWRLAARCCWGVLQPVPLEARGAFPRALLQAWPAPTAPSRLGIRAPMTPQGRRRKAKLGSCKAWGVCGLPKRRLGWRVPPPHCVEGRIGRSGAALQSPPRPGRTEPPTLRIRFSLRLRA